METFLGTQRNAGIVFTMILEIIKLQQAIEDNGEGKWLQPLKETLGDALYEQIVLRLPLEVVRTTISSCYRQTHAGVKGTRLSSETLKRLTYSGKTNANKGQNRNQIGNLVQKDRHRPSQGRRLISIHAEAELFSQFNCRDKTCDNVTSDLDT